MSFDVFTDRASGASFCMVYDGEVAPLLRSSSDHLRNFPIYHDISILHTDVINTNINSPYPVSVKQLLKFDIVLCDS